MYNKFHLKKNFFLYNFIMELLNFYAKILPDDLFKKRDAITEKSIDNAFKYIVNDHVKNSKINDDSWVKQFQLATYSKEPITDLNNTKYTNIENLNFDYKVVKDPQFKHNNMYHNRGGFTIINGERIPQPVFNKNPIIENFLGNSFDRIPVKQEVPNMFSPLENVSIRKTQQTDFTTLKDRMVTSDRRNDARLTEPERVPPGLGRDPNDNSQRGLHPLVRIMPKNVDDLRTAIHQKVTYKNQVVPGQFISKQPVVTPFEKRTADTFMVDRPVERGRSQYTATKREGEFNMKPTERNINNKGYTGPAYSSATYSKEQRLNYNIENPKRNEYKEPEPLGPTTSVKAQALNDPSTILLPDTQRQTTSNNSYRSGISTQHNKIKAVNYSDRPKDTIKQTTLMNEILGMTGSVKKETVYNPSDVPKNTIKQTNITNPNQLGYIMSSIQTGDYVFNPQDLPKNTLKETSINNNDLLGYIMSGGPLGSVYDPNDVPKETIKQTTINNPENFGTVVSSRVPESQSYNPFDLPKNTTKQTTLINAENVGYVTGAQIGQIAFDPNDVPKDTIKQTTVINNNETIISSRVPQSQVYDPKNTPKNTIRQTTEVNADNYGFISSFFTGSQMYDPNDKPKETIKQTTHLENYTSQIHNTGMSGSGYISNQQQSNTTQREINPNSMPGASSAQFKKHVQVEQNNITMRDCRNEINKEEEKRYPTQVSLAHIPQINTQGSFRLPSKAFSTREILPNSIKNTVCLDRNIDSKNVIPSRELSWYDRVELEAQSGNTQRNTIDLSRPKLKTRNEMVIEY